MEENSNLTVPAEIRRERIASLVQSQPFVRVDYLSEEFGISEVTVRSDLATLERDGELRRVRGGAAPNAGERSFEESLEELTAEKMSIGRAAAALVNSGDKIMLDVGTTSNAVAQALLARTELEDVVIVTNGVNIALALEPAIPRFTVLVTGGTLRPLQHSLVDPLGGTMLDQLRADTCFVGCNGVSIEGGVTNANIAEAAIKQRMISGAQKTVVMADRSKIGMTSAALILDLQNVDVLITNRDSESALLEQIGDMGVDVVAV